MAQQKLTPRQKMINMMYLVLTALLALNVSKETLDVIAKVEYSLNQTIENFVSQNNLTYADFEQAYMVNPEKVGPFKEKADQVRQQSQILVDKINEYKWAIVKEADGEDKARLDSIKNMEDVNVPAQIMLTEKPIDLDNKKISRATDLRNSINAYREFLLTIVDPNDSVLVQSIVTGLEIVDIQGTRNEPSRSWEQDNFEYLPLIGVITLMSKMQSDVRNAESDVLNYLYSGIDEESFKFNALMPVVIPKTSTMVVEGNPYEAEILLAAVDTTQDPSISVNGRAIQVKDGVGLWRTIGEKAGHYKWGGIIRYKAPDGRTLSYDFEEEYDVIPPVLIVSPTKMNVFYEGLANPIEVNVPGSTPGSVQIQVTNGNYRKVSEYSYEVMPTQNYGESIVKVSAEFNGQRRQMPDKRFRLKPVPPPIAKLAGKNSGSIEKSELTTQQGLTAVQDDFLFDIKYTVTRFTIVVTKGEFTDDRVSNSQRFTDEQKRLLSGLRRGDRFVIEDIYAEDPNGREIPLTSINFKIQ
jgi:gliding motility-associated protein GldM